MVLEFEQDEARIEWEPDASVTADIYQVKVYAQPKDGGSKSLVHTSQEFELGTGKHLYRLTIDYMYYNRAAKATATGSGPLPNILEFSFAILIEGEETEVADVVEVHFVRYVPQLMGIKGFSNAEGLQRIWFTRGSNINKDSVDPEIDAVTFSWATSESSQVRTEANQFIRATENALNAWTNTAPKRSLKAEINRMVTDGKMSLPASQGSKTSFGVTSKAIITHRGEKMPEYEKYYFNSKSFSGFFDMGVHFMTDGLDDFVASLANFNFHMYAKGELVYNEPGLISNASVQVNVKQLGIYIKDSYDFIDDDPSAASQELGFWRIDSRDAITIERTRDNPSGFFEVTNKSYRDYRDAHQMGYNYHLYSTVKLESINANFKL
ncbi:hypothetical protein GCM10009117_14160 [Gangjinia marincola]|uniref:Uncharacterized protein n=1 Tax=Gangjinia marincola TaxID=578463 RepID=A0ABP3XS73_9FLAO